MTSQFKPQHVAQQACGNSERGENDQIRLAVARHGSCGQQYRNRRDGKAGLFREDGQEHHEFDVAEEKF
jgi:hypothetical protein